MTTLNSILPKQVEDSLIVIHAMKGCDRTLFLFGIGKSKLYKNQKQMECDENDDEMLGHISDEFSLTFSSE